MVTSRQEPACELEVPINCFEFGLDETNVFFEPRMIGFMTQEPRIIRVSQRELQRKVTPTWNKDENLARSAAVIMLLML